jgi:mitogen-activated protein kinase kinase kinase
VARIANFESTRSLPNREMSAYITGLFQGMPFDVSTRYAAPEVLRALTGGRDDLVFLNRVDVLKQGDIYALGMVVYEMITGRKPWADMNRAELIAKVLEGVRPPIDAIKPEFVPLLERLWHHDPLQRAQSHQLINE